jgi:hypothetical protein
MTPSSPLDRASWNWLPQEAPRPHQYVCFRRRFELCTAPLRRAEGVRPLEPGFRRFLINPYPDRFASARGRVPVPGRAIEVSWLRGRRGLAVEATGPEELTPVVTAHEEAPIERATYNGRRVPSAAGAFRR